MVSKKDVDFLGNIGGRTMKGDKDKILSNEKGVGEHLLEIQRRAEEQKTEQEIVKQTFGIGTSDKTSDVPAIKVAKEALDIQSATIKSLDEARKITQDALIKAETEKNNALTQLYSLQMNTIKDAEARVQAAAARIEGGEKPKSAMDTFREIKGELDKMIEETPKPSPPSQAGLSEETQIKLKQMELDQSRVLFGLQADAEQRRREWDLKMREFEEDTRRRWAEYKDSREFREQGITGFTDLITSVGASVTKERIVGSGESDLEASISQFPCQVCQTPIEVKPGATSIKCPKEGCGAEYQVKESAG